MDATFGDQGPVTFGPFLLDPMRRKLLRGGAPIALPAKQFELLLYLAGNAGRAIEKDELLAAVWGVRCVEEGNLSQAVSRLRRALRDGTAENYIVTAPGIGYRFAAEVRRAHDRAHIAPMAETPAHAPGRMAKLSPPRLPATIARKRLFALLDEYTQRKIVWVTGPPGAGKTTLVCSYVDSVRAASIWYVVDSGDADPASFFFHLREAALELAPGAASLPLLSPEYLADIPGFTRRFFRGLMLCLPLRLILVLDNWQEAPETSLLGLTIRDAASELSDGVALIIISRQEPPPVFARLRANQDMVLLGWSDLRLTQAEVLAISAQHNRAEAVSVPILHQRCDGWVAGLTLLLEAGEGNNRHPGAGPNAPPRAVFDYFMTELFERAPQEIRSIWLATAYLPHFTADGAATLSGNPNAGRMLDDLAQRRLFTDRDRSHFVNYKYHGLFREFLVEHAERYMSGEERRALAIRSACIMDESGDFDTALQLYDLVGDGEACARVLLTHARTLISQGRWRTLLQWLQRLPPACTENTPWLTYWLGACQGQADLASGRSMMERAYAYFVTAGDRTGQAMSICAVIETTLLQYGDFDGIEAWIGLLEVFIRRGAPLPTHAMDLRLHAVFLSALTYCLPQGDLTASTRNRVALLCSRDDISAGDRLMAASSLVLSMAWYANCDGAKAVISQFGHLALALETTPLQRSTWFYSESFVHCDAGDIAGWKRTALLGERLATENGLAVLGSWWSNLAVWQALTEGRLSEAEAALNGMEAEILDAGFAAIAHFHLSHTWLALLRKRPKLALEHSRTALALIRSRCTSTRLPVTLTFHAYALAACSDMERAAAAAREAAAWFGQANESVLHQGALLAQSHALIGLDLREQALAAISEAMAIGRRGAHFHSTPWLPDMMRNLTTLALAENIETDYVGELIRRRNLAVGMEI